MRRFEEAFRFPFPHFTRKLSTQRDNALLFKALCGLYTFNKGWKYELMLDYTTVLQQLGFRRARIRLDCDVSIVQKMQFQCNSLRQFENKYTFRWLFFFLHTLKLLISKIFWVTSFVALGFHTSHVAVCAIKPVFWFTIGFAVCLWPGCFTTLLIKNNSMFHAGARRVFRLIVCIYSFWVSVK